MNGQPVWLASISRRDRGRIVPVPRWDLGTKAEAVAKLRAVLSGVGDETQERLFRMNVTLCIHRAASPEDQARMPSWFWEAPGCGLAGGPVEVLSETVPGAQSTKPCRSPRKRSMDATDPLMWFPMDCGKCPPCKARARI